MEKSKGKKGLRIGAIVAIVLIIVACVVYLTIGQDYVDKQNKVAKVYDQCMSDSLYDTMYTGEKRETFCKCRANTLAEIDMNEAGALETGSAWGRLLDGTQSVYDEGNVGSFYYCNTVAFDKEKEDK